MALSTYQIWEAEENSAERIQLQSGLVTEYKSITIIL